MQCAKRVSIDIQLINIQIAVFPNLKYQNFLYSPTPLFNVVIHLQIMTLIAAYFATSCFWGGGSLIPSVHKELSSCCPNEFCQQ